MPIRKRKQREHTEDWQTIKQYTLWPEQAAYELLRPVVLFGDPAIQRARETGEAKSTLDRKADAFEESGMVSLFATKPQKQPQESARSLPPDMRQLIVDLRIELPTMSLREIAEICDVRCGRIKVDPSPGLPGTVPAMATPSQPVRQTVSHYWVPKGIPAGLARSRRNRGRKAA